MVKSKTPGTEIARPTLSGGAIYHGNDSDDNFYLLGGTTSYFNTSFPGFSGPTPAKNGLWSFNIKKQAWSQYDTSAEIANRPSEGSATEARQQSLGFYFNGQIDSGSSTETQNLGNTGTMFLKGMLVINTADKTIKNLSTEAVVGDMPRARGRMMFVDGVGSNGILVQIGGVSKSAGDVTENYNGQLVTSCDPIAFKTI